MIFANNRNFTEARETTRPGSLTYQHMITSKRTAHTYFSVKGYDRLILAFPYFVSYCWYFVFFFHFGHKRS
jgi:hypothetical protein